ncbi:hypothetical protein GCM10011519_32090 [Marmoricola endophyticus]|uniref:Uncharacterized protein n=1 Tax=Marmoricola endophyticus TaxID=2040280 RepID=A0A917F6H6_9ACTN|nr:hypothetical protein GCM10011519_32090 [Marmoricola endophyticus]
MTARAVGRYDWIVPITTSQGDPMTRVRRILTAVDRYTLWAFNAQAPLAHRGYRG